MSTKGWTVTDMPDLTGTTAVVTGANRGIGLEIARGLARNGAHVVLAVRRPGRGEAAAAAIRATSPAASVEVMALDLADLASVHRFAAAVSSRWQALDLLINNAGVGSASLRRTADGFELVFGTNHLSHFALTGLLLPALTGPPAARVVTVASLAHTRGHIDFGNLDGSNGYAMGRAYAQSKLANLLFAYELHRRLDAAGAGLLSVAAHPGWAATEMEIRPPGEGRRPLEAVAHVLTMHLAASPAQGAQPSLYAATAPQVRGGDYIGPRSGLRGPPAPVRSSDRSHDPELARRLWQVSEDMTGVHFSFPAAGTRLTLP
ncbi:MAG TPA: oxidoreductase [Streptosporangiaceae bacterium]|nr:oxidoreductase [Streptosporangiaceae bacterium]